MSGRPVIVVGAGGHGAVVADSLLAEGRTVLGFVDARPESASGLPGLDVLGSDERLDPEAGYDLANGIGGTGAGGDGPAAGRAAGAGAPSAGSAWSSSR